jgi:diguanylate cyclase (GGDEF)-like protein/PAS domain S-box-containing protein
LPAPTTESTARPRRRPLEGEGVTRRIAPFAIAAGFAYVLAVFVRTDDNGRDLLAAGLLIPLLLGSVYLVPWHRIAAWWQTLPPLGFLVVVALIRNDTGGADSEFTALAVLPLIWFCLYGTRGQLLVSTAAEAATLALPALLVGAPDYPPTEMIRALVTAGVSGTLGLAAQQLVTTAHEQEAEQRSILESAQESFISIDAHGVIREWNPQAEIDFGWSRAEAIGRRLEETIIPERMRAGHRAGIARHLETGETNVLGRRVEMSALRRDGSEFPIELSVSRLDTASGVRFNAFIHDITERREAGVDLRAAEERFRRAFDDAAIGMALVSTDGQFQRVNRALTDITGYGAERLTGMTFAEITHPDDRSRDLEALQRMVGGEIDRYQTEKRYVHADGRTVWINLNVSAVRDGEGRLLYFITQMQDTSERKQAEEKLAHQASHDPLTGLPNRTLLDDRMTVALARLRRAELPFAVLFLDLDRFKLVNDSFGHEAGDRLLLEVAERLKRLLRPSDTVARLGGDEFALLCESMSPDAAATLAGRVGEAIAEPIRIEGRDVVVTSSVGIALNNDPDVSPGTLLANADAAMYDAKTRGRSRFAFFATEMRTRASGRLELESELRRAVAAGDLTVHYQPQVDLRSGRVIGLEALARWAHPEHGLLPAAEFIPIAEESELIALIGGHVLREAVEQGRRWRAAGAPDLRVTVNVSGRQVGGPGLTAAVAEALSEAHLPAAALCIEMTESAIGEDPEGALETLRDLKDLGVTLAVDEFVLGSSTIGLLRRLPELDALKIDPSFVAGLEGDGEQELVAVIIGMARAFKMTAIAEGVETAAQARALRALGCDAAQGMFISAPVPAEAVEELLATPALEAEPA